MTNCFKLGDLDQFSINNVFFVRHLFASAESITITVYVNKTVHFKKTTQIGYLETDCNNNFALGDSDIFIKTYPINRRVAKFDKMLFVIDNSQFRFYGGNDLQIDDSEETLNDLLNNKDVKFSSCELDIFVKFKFKETPLKINYDTPLNIHNYLSNFLSSCSNPKIRVLLQTETINFDFVLKTSCITMKNKTVYIMEDAIKRRLFAISNNCFIYSEHVQMETSNNWQWFTVFEVFSTDFIKVSVNSYKYDSLINCSVTNTVNNFKNLSIQSL